MWRWAGRPAGRPAERLAGRLAKRPAGRPAGRSWAVPVSSAAPKKKHLIEEASFGRLDQMLRTTDWGGGSGGAAPPQPKTGESGGQRPPAKTEKN